MVLQEKEIEVNGKKIIVKELGWEEGLDFFALNEDIKQRAKKIFLKVGLSEEEISQLGTRHYLKIINVFNQLNGLNEDFSNPKA